MMTRFLKSTVKHNTESKQNRTKFQVDIITKHELDNWAKLPLSLRVPHTMEALTHYNAASFQDY